MTRPVYPAARIEPATDTLAGVSFADPYRWLEDDHDPEVQRWQAAQARLASDTVRRWPGFDTLQAMVTRFAAQRWPALPRFAAGAWFQIEHGRAVVAARPFGLGRVLFDAAPAFLSWISPSPDGRTLAVGVCADGSDINTIQLIDVNSGRRLDRAPTRKLMDSRAGGAQWLPDSSGFFFTGTGADFTQRVYLHRLYGSTVEAAIPWTCAKEYRMAVVSTDGRHAIALERFNNVIPVAVTAFDGTELRWRPFITSIPNVVAGHIVGDRYVAITDLDAPRGRLVAIPLDASNPNDPSTWQELVPQSDAVLRVVTPVGNVLYLTELVDAHARVRIVAQDGAPLSEVPLPGKGALGDRPFPFENLVPGGHPDQFLFAFSTLTQGPGIYRHAGGNIETLKAPIISLNAAVETRIATSRDRTKVPYHVVGSAGQGPRPTLLYAYGGFNVPFVPQFPGTLAAFVAAGGVLVHAHLRGGGEFGRDWWLDGRHAHKQNCYDDLYAVAEDLIASDLCTPRTLAVYGESNGGLMAAVAAMQRPDLWAAAVSRVPRLDLIGACRSAFGLRNTLEDRAENVDDPDVVRRLASISPYHLVKDGISPPAMFIAAGSTDQRCPPQDARKFTARLQHAATGDAPILLHVWDNAGHGASTDAGTTILEHTEWLAFMMQRLGMSGP